MRLGEKLPKQIEPMVLAFIDYDYTESFVDALLMAGVTTYKLYMKNTLKDEHSIHFDEIPTGINVVICDSIPTARLAMMCPVNHARFYFMDSGVNPEDALVRGEDFYTVEVKHASNKTRNDWEEAAVLFAEHLSKSLNSSPYIRA